jgi:putative sterol carrier protein
MMTAKDFLFALPEKVSPDALVGHTTNFHFDVEGEGEYTVAIDDGKLHVSEGFHGDTKCTVKAKGTDLVKLVSGDLNPMMAVFSGKLKISNLGEMQKYAKILGLM